MYKIRINRKKQTIKIEHVTRKVKINTINRRVIIRGASKRGLPGRGIPVGGTTGQILKKKSDAPYDTEWRDEQTAAVKSVAGKTGDVVLVKSDVGLGNVDNTSDSNKPISNATQSALDLKANVADLADVATSGDYDDLTNKPTIPDVSGFVPNTRTINGHALTGDITVTKSDVGLGSVDNTSDANKPISTATQTALDGKLDDSLKGAPNGLAELDGSGKVPSTQLPSYVDDVIEAADFASLPVTGEDNKIYITLDDNKTYRWGGSSYVQIGSPLVLGETISTAYRGDRGKIAYDHSQLTSGNPHNVTKSDVGLSNVDNTSDLGKPISTATQGALDLKADISSLATVATSGDYDDLSNKPTIPSITNLVPYTGATSNIDLNLKDILNAANIHGTEFYGDNYYMGPGDSEAYFGANLDGSNPGAPVHIVAGDGNDDGSTPNGDINLYVGGNSTLNSIGSVYMRDRVIGSGVQWVLPADRGFHTITTPDDNIDLNDVKLINQKADDGAVVHIVNDEAIDGIKTFNASPIVPTPAGSTSAVNKTYVDVGLSAKEPTLTAGTTGQYYRGDKSWQTLDKTAVGLSNVDNTSDASKPVSTATQTALNLKANDNSVVHLTGAETVAGVKTFSSSPIIPTPTTSLQPTTKDYADKIRQSAFIVARSGVADYVCDGTADDVEIQAAINAASAAGRGYVFVRAHTNPYRISATITIPENVTVFGERMARQSVGGVTFKTAASTTLTDMFQVAGASNPSSNADLIHDVHFENITFDGNNSTTNGVKLINQDTTKFINCRFIQSTNPVVTVWDSTVAPTASTIPGGIYMERCNVSPASGGIGIDLQYQTQCWITNCWFTPPSGTPAAMIRIKSSNKIYIDGAEFNTATTAIVLEDVNTGGGLDFPCHNIAIYAKTFNTGGTVLDDNRTHANSSRVEIYGTMASGTTAGDTLVGTGNVALLGGKNTFSGDVIVEDEVYSSSWDGNMEVPTKNALYDKIESVVAGGDGGVVDTIIAGASITVDDTDPANPIVAFDGTGWVTEEQAIAYAIAL